MNRFFRGVLTATLLLGYAMVEATHAEVRRPQILQVEATAYCTEGETASGVQTRRRHRRRRSPGHPLGSRIRVDGLGRRHSRTYDVEDTGRLVKGRENRQLHG